MKEMAGYGPITEIEFLRKNNNRSVSRQKKIRTIKIKSFHVFLIIILFVASGYAAFSVGKFMTGWDKLNIKTFRLINTPEFRGNDVKDIINRYGGNILTLNTDRLRDDLLTIGEVSDVSISRRLPATVDVRFILRKPAFQFSFKGKYKIIDKEGVEISESKFKRNGILVIRNVTPKGIKKIIPVLSGLLKIKEKIEFISFREHYGTALKLKGSEEIFYTGNGMNLKKIKQYFKLIRKLGYKDGDIKSVDLRFRNRFYLEFEKEII